MTALQRLERAHHPAVPRLIRSVLNDPDLRIATAAIRTLGDIGDDWAVELQRERWQRVIDETVWHYRRMWFNPRYKAVGLAGTPFYLLTEVLAPAFELVAMGALFASIVLGLFDPMTFLVMLAAIAFTNAALTASAILLDDLQSRSYRKRDLFALLLLTPFDFVVYRPIILWARLKGSWGFLRGDKSWNKFERNVRAPA